jgi:hypothetical protein
MGHTAEKGMVPVAVLAALAAMVQGHPRRQEATVAVLDALEAAGVCSMDEVACMVSGYGLMDGSARGGMPVAVLVMLVSRVRGHGARQEATASVLSALEGLGVCGPLDITNLCARHEAMRKDVQAKAGGEGKDRAYREVCPAYPEFGNVYMQTDG